MPNPVPRWAFVGAEIIVIDPKHNGSFSNRGRAHDLAWVGKIADVTRAGVIHVEHGPDRHKRKWKTYTASDVFADQALSNEPKGGAFVPRTNYRILPATLANLSEHNAALRADEEIAARQLRQAEALKRSRDERNAAIDRRREALTRILHEVNSLDADQREALRWAIKENARDPDTTL